MIKRGSNVKIIAQGFSGTVVDIQDGFAEVSYQNVKNWFPMSQLIDTADDLLGKLTSGDLNDDVDFKLSMDAYRLRNAQSWEPYVLAASNKIDIFPHQIDELTWVLDRQRVLVADEVGLGKTIIAALVAAELRARGVVKKALVVVPKALVLKWKDELGEKFEIKSTILSATEERVTEETFQKEEYLYISSIDYMKQPHIIQHLKDATLDMVIIDEAHKLNPGKQRFTLGEELSRMATYMMFLTATPHDGVDENFLARMKLLDPWTSDVDSSNHLWVRNMKEDVVDIKGDNVFPGRTSKTHEITISKDEEKVYEKLNEYLMNRIDEAQTSQERNAVRFLRIIFLKRCSSSIVSLKISLERRLEKLGSVHIEDFEDYRKNIHDADEQFDEVKFEAERERAEALTVTHDLDQEKSDLKNLIEIVKSTSGRDSKLEWLDGNISDLKRDDASAKLLIFTEYKDTMFVIQEYLLQKYSVGIVHGGMSTEDRKQEINKFRNGDVEILVCTDAAGEGLDMQFCNIEINYDLPWNPNKIEQRMGRIHRIGQDRDVKYHNYVIKSEKSTDGYIQTKLLEKIDTIKEALDDKIYDIFGTFISEKDIELLSEELARTPYAEWEPKTIMCLEDIEENKKKILMTNKRLLTAHRFNKNKLDDIKKIKKHAVDVNDVKRFLTMYCDRFGGKMSKNGDKVWKIFLPRNVAEDVNEQVLVGTFERKVATKQNYPYIALGSKVVTSMLKNASKRSAAILLHHTRSGIMFVYKLTALNGRNAPRGEKILFLFHNEDETIDEVDGGSLWEYEPAENTTVDTDKIFDFYGCVIRHVDDTLETFEHAIQDKLNAIRKNTERAVREYHGRETEIIKSRIQEYKQRRHEGPHIESLISKQTKELKRLDERLDKKLKDISTESNIVCNKEMIGVALVISDDNAAMRNRVGDEGERLVYEYERRRATTDEEQNQVKDVSRNDCGYDIESFGKRCIEVKSFTNTGIPALTNNEWDRAEKIGDDYYLYVIEDVFGKRDLTIIQNPYKMFSGEIIKKEIIDYRYEIQNWKSKTNTIHERLGEMGM